MRRVAHGQSDVARLRAEDLARLRTLCLIDAGPRPHLTAQGKQRLERLTKPVPLASFDVESELTTLIARLKGRR